MNENLTQMRLCFAPKDHGCGADFDAYLTVAFQRGEVLSMEDFAYQWQNKGGEYYANFDMRLIEVYNTTWEMCPHCEHEVELKAKWEVQICPVCGNPIAPCSLCGSHCMSDCPLEHLVKKAELVRKEIPNTKENFTKRVLDAIEKAKANIYDERNPLDLRAARSPYDAHEDLEIFMLDQIDQAYEFIKDSDEWYVDVYENFVGANYAEFTGHAVIS